MAAFKQKREASKPQSTSALGPKRPRPLNNETPLHPLHGIHYLQQTLGNQGVLARLQAKLEVNDPGDVYEQEADRIADAVTAQSSSQVATPTLRASGPAPVQRQCIECEEDKDRVQRQESSTAPPAVAACSIVEQSLNSPGQPLDVSTRSFMENRFGQDFSNVRVHTDAMAANSASAVHATAYTVGKDVVFGAGHYNPGSAQGRRLLAHELTHVVQQSPRRETPMLPSAGTARVRGASATRIARQTATPIPTTLSFLKPDDIRKLQGFGDTDFQSSLNTLQGHLRKTGGVTTAGNSQKYIDIRQASGEVRTFLDYIRNPDVAAVKVVPSATGGRSPDLYVRYLSGVEERAEIYNLTLASPQYRPQLRTDLPGQPPRIPTVATPAGGSQVDLPTNEFEITAVREAIRSKIRTGSKGPSQLSAQNINTQVSGRPMAPGGDVVIQITHGEVTRAGLDQIVRDLEPELLASPARRIVISAVDANEPRGGRKVFEYTRGATSFEGSVRAPFYRPVTPERPTPVAEGPLVTWKGAGGFLFSIVIAIVINYILQKIGQAIDKRQIDAAVKGLEPMIAAQFNAKYDEIMERESASAEPLYSTISYSLTFRHNLINQASNDLFFAPTEAPGLFEEMKAQEALMKGQQDITFFFGASNPLITIGSGVKPPDQSQLSLVHDEKYNLYEDEVYTISTSASLPRVSNVELRDYVLSNVLKAELGGPESLSPEKSEEIQQRLQRLQGAVANDEAREKAQRLADQKAEEERKQAKLKAAREASATPPRTSQQFLAPPGPPPISQPLSATADPFNFTGRPEVKSLFDQAKDAADVTEALKSEFTRRAEDLNAGKLSDAEADKYRTDVESWIDFLHNKFYPAWKAKGADWEPIKRIEFVNWWVDQPDGKKALLR
jgi:hypothetical protein